MKVTMTSLAIVLLMAMLTGGTRGLFTKYYPDTSFFSYNYSISAMEKAWSRIPSKWIKYHHQSFDVSGPLFTAQATKNLITMDQGSVLKITPLPQNSGKYEKYIKDSANFQIDNEELFDDSDYADEGLIPKDANDENNDGFFYINLGGDDNYDNRLQKKTVKVGETRKEYGFYSYKREYKSGTHMYNNLGKIDGILFRISNASFRVQSTFNIGQESYQVDLKMKNVTFNRTIHYEYRKGGLKLVSSICKIKSRLSLLVLSDKKRVKTFLDNINVQEIISNELCKIENLYTRVGFEKLFSPEKLVIKFHPSLYLDMRLLKPVLTNDMIGFRHVGEFIHDSEKIKNLPEKYNNMFKAEGPRGYMSIMLRSILKHIENQKSDIICDALYSIEGKTNIGKDTVGNVTKDYILVDKKDIKGGSGKKEEAGMSENGADKTTGDFLVRMRLHESMLNSLIDGIIVSNLTNIHFNHTHVEKGCGEISVFNPLCTAVRDCAKAKEMLKQKFTFSFKQLRTPTGTYVTLRNGLISYNTSFVISFNQQSAKLTVQSQMKLSFEGDKFSYEVLYYSIKMTANSKFHSYFDEKSLKEIIKDKIAFSASVSPKPGIMQIFSSIRDGSFTLAFNPLP